MLSTFEVALLDRHLRRCSECRAFAIGAVRQTELLRSAELEQPLRPVVVSGRPSRAHRRVGGALSAALVAAAAAFMLVLPGTQQQGTGQAQDVGVGAPVLVVFAARPTLAVKIDVPRVRIQPASIADGPVHGAFSVPVV